MPAVYAEKKLHDRKLWQILHVAAKSGQACGARSGKNPDPTTTDRDRDFEIKFELGRISKSRILHMTAKIEIKKRIQLQHEHFSSSVAPGAHLSLKQQKTENHFFSPFTPFLQHANFRNFEKNTMRENCVLGHRTLSTLGSITIIFARFSGGERWACSSYSYSWSHGKTM